MASAVSFQNVSRHYGDVKAVDNVNFKVDDGEFFAMLGPSGSGKTTCLRLIAGFELPTQGRVYLADQDVTAIPPYQRSVNTVFQDYALFPHLSVADNVSYGLMVSGMPKKARLAQAEAALELVKLEGFSKRKPAALSGGQRQRVALARALVNQPDVLLLDEPLGALDLKLREQMQEELKALQRHLGITFILVTHDQGEALSMADRLAVFAEGKVQQIGKPKDIYRRPVSTFVADFVGSSNVLPPDLVNQLVGKNHWGSLRPESVSLVQAGGVQVRVDSTSYMGGQTKLNLDYNGHCLTMLMSSSLPIPQQGEVVRVGWDNDALHVMETS